MSKTYREQFYEGDIEAKTLLDVIDGLLKERSGEKCLLLKVEMSAADLREALRWYADHRNYYASSGSGNTMLLDGGRRAAAALKAAGRA